jgi:hypothetical protein
MHREHQAVANRRKQLLYLRCYEEDVDALIHLFRSYLENAFRNASSVEGSGKPDNEPAHVQWDPISFL